MSDYEVKTFGLGFRVSQEVIDDGLFQATHDLMVEQLRLVNLRMDVSMGGGLSPSDAAFVMAKCDEAVSELAKLRAEKPPPTLLNTVRRWLADKIKPPRNDDEDY